MLLLIILPFNYKNSYSRIVINVKIKIYIKKKKK